MKKEIGKGANKTWYVAYNNNDVVHYGFVDLNQTMTTGQPFLDEFTTEEDMILKVDELKGDGWYASQNDNDDDVIDLDI
jgi:hypothetical protein